MKTHQGFSLLGTANRCRYHPDHRYDCDSKFVAVTAISTRIGGGRPNQDDQYGRSDVSLIQSRCLRQYSPADYSGLVR
jgi:hypothetical protein